MSVNPTIGRLKCPLTGEVAEVRRNKKGKYYYLSSAGMITPSLPDGQSWLIANAQMFEAAEVKEVNENGIEFGRRFGVDAEFQKPNNAGTGLMGL